MLSYSFLLLLCYAHSTLVQLYVIQRTPLHTPLVDFPTNKSPFTQFGSILTTSVDQSISLGKQVRSSYFSSSGFSELYNGSTNSFFSTFLPRSQKNAFSFLSGLYPNDGPEDNFTSTEIEIEKRMKKLNKENEKNNYNYNYNNSYSNDDPLPPLFEDAYQPVPIRNSLPHNEYILLSTKLCYQSILQQTRNYNNWREKKSESEREEEKKARKRIIEITRSTNSDEEIFNAEESLYYLRKMNETLPDGVSVEEIDSLHNFLTQAYTNYYTYSYDFCAASIGSFLRHMSSNLQNPKIAIPHIFYYSAHRSTLLSLFSCLVDSSLLYPNPSSLFIIEVHSSLPYLPSTATTTDNFLSSLSFRILYDFNIPDNGSAVFTEGKMRNGGNSNSYDQLASFYSSVLSSSQNEYYYNHCGKNDDYFSYTSNKSITWFNFILFCVGVGLFAIFIVLFTLFIFFCAYEKFLKRSDYLAIN